RASEQENADLLWALRGGGGNFGVVTAMEFQLHPVGPTVAAATVFHDLETAPDVLRAYRAFATGAPDSVACYAMIVNAPPDFPPEHQGKPVLAIVACCSGSVAEGLTRLRPLGQWGAPLVSVIDEMPYVALQQAFNAGNPHGGRYYWKAQHLPELSDGLLDTVVRFARDLHGPMTIIGIEPLGGAHAQVPSDATAFAYRDVPFSLGIWTGWENPADDEANMAWTRSFFTAVQPFGTGVYVNYLSEDEGDRVEEAYGRNYAKLVELKRRWDPDNLFHENQNIPARTQPA
ncbi:MAG: BBE domain-containing protein, partial [Pseudomonadales bacterium]